MNLYYDNGFLNVPAIDAYADKHGVAFILIIGKRQVGKTYGVLQLELNEDRRFILMRRTNKELRVIRKPQNHPFNPIAGYENRILMEGSEDDGVLDLMRIDTQEDGSETKTQIGIAVSLTGIASIRGFNGSIYTDLVYDECIPEAHVYKVKNEDDAFNNAHVTISGNRELEGKPPLKTWLIANSNKLDCAILRALNLTDIVERMSRNDEEMRLLKDRGILILMPDSHVIAEKRAQTALYKAISGENKFTRMSLGNEFSYNDYSDVKHVQIREYTTLCIINKIGIYKHKSRPECYACNVSGTYIGGGTPTYLDTDYWRRRFQKEFPSLRAYYQRGKIFFQNATVKAEVESFIFD